MHNLIGHLDLLQMVGFRSHGTAPAPAAAAKTTSINHYHCCCGCNCSCCYYLCYCFALLVLLLASTAVADWQFPCPCIHPAGVGDMRHGTEGWKCLETSMKAFQQLVEGTGQDIRTVINQDILDLLCR